MGYYGPLRDLPGKLRDQAQALETLAKIPDHTTAADLRAAAKTLTDAYDGLLLLFKGELIGCTCRRIEHDDHGSYLVYDEKCVHHGRYHTSSEKLKKDYGELEKKLKNELRAKFMAAAISSIADGSSDPSFIAERALRLADAAVEALSR